VQSFSDWSSPQNFTGELEAAAMPYRNYQDGTKNLGTVNLYAYAFALDPSKTVQMLVLPTDANLVVLAATLR